MLQSKIARKKTAIDKEIDRLHAKLMLLMEECPHPEDKRRTFCYMFEVEHECEDCGKVWME